MHIFTALIVTLACMIWPLTDDYAFCEWLDAVDTHYDLLASFAPAIAYDSLAYPDDLANQVNARLINAGCDY